MSEHDLSQMSLLDLFRLEADNQSQILTAGLLVLERDPVAEEELETCMRAAHSLKGAARIVGLGAGVQVAHAMEDAFVAAQQGRIRLHKERIDLLLQGVDLLLRIARTPETEMNRWEEAGKQEIDALLAALARVRESGNKEEPGAEEPEAEEPGAGTGTNAEADAISPAAGIGGSIQPVEAPPAGATDRITTDRVLRVTADNLNRLLGLASESLVEARRLKPFAESLLQLKRLQYDSGQALERLRGALSDQVLNERARTALTETRQHILSCQHTLSQRLVELERFDRRSVELSHRLYEEALACRMRPFADGIKAFPRMVRDLGHALGKQVRLEVGGEATRVDRDILERLDAPLGHLLRNAVDHGIETPEQRRSAGKPAEGVVYLEARHSGGLLQITIADDGRGIDPDQLRAAIVTRNLSSSETAGRLSETELLEFLFLPGFTMKSTVTEVSGRGVGLDVVQHMVKQVRGTVRVASQPDRETRFQLHLPLTLSVVRTLLVEIGGEPYAFPLAGITCTLMLPKQAIELLEGRQHFALDQEHIGLIAAHQVLEGGESRFEGDDLSVIVLKNDGTLYGLAVDRFLGEGELVVQPLDERLGKIRNITAGALMKDGSPVLIVDVEDMVRSVERLVSTGRLSKVRQNAVADAGKRCKRVLVVDDSLTVRELERKLLGNRGYEVEVAVDGMDGWNAVRTGHFDLVVTDIDMPRMDGIELVTLIKQDPHLHDLPVMIVSYKDREEDRQRGLHAGADYYLAKGGFDEETLMQAVMDLVGEAEA